MKKIHQGFFWLLIFLLPVQLGRHFWPEWSYVLGLRVDYLSPTLYLTDILVIIILGFWFWEIKNHFKLKAWLKQSWWVLAIFIYLLLTSLLAQNPGVALYKFVKLVELTFLGLYVAKTKPVPNKLALPLSGGVIYSSLIGLGQFLNQASLGGPLWWLGERTFTRATPGIAQAILNGQLFLRPYATFSHPNVLAGFILVSLILLSQLTKSNWLTLFLGITTIIFAFSRSVWLVGLLILLIQQARAKKKQKLISLIVGLSLIAVLFFGFRLSTEEALVQRLELIKIANQMIKEFPLTGIGLNNFVVRLPEFWQRQTIYWLQPVHNLFYLVTAELGLVGLLVFVWFLILTFRKKVLVLSLLTILLLGLFDHYWFTLQQTQLLGAIILGLAWAKPN